MKFVCKYCGGEMKDLGNGGYSCQACFRLTKQREKGFKIDPDEPIEVI